MTLIGIGVVLGVVVPRLVRALVRAVVRWHSSIWVRRADPLDTCCCGDYRRQHSGPNHEGPCEACTPETWGCHRFRLFERNRLTVVA